MTTAADLHLKNLADEGMTVTPFTPDQVESLNGFQRSGLFHPFTCGFDECRAVLLAASDGWHCPACNYRQGWAHRFMADGSWRAHPFLKGAADPRSGGAA